jgi:hypothetical protein
MTPDQVRHTPAVIGVFVPLTLDGERSFGKGHGTLGLSGGVKRRSLQPALSANRAAMRSD